jgi:hypothetical protein
LDGASAAGVVDRRRVAREDGPASDVGIRGQSQQVDWSVTAFQTATTTIYLPTRRCRSDPQFDLSTRADADHQRLK